MPASFSLASAECFLALYEERNLSAAARRLDIGLSTISMKWRRLEEAWGLILFERKGRSLRPTAEAERLYPACRRIVTQTVQFASLLESVHQGCAMPLLRLGATPMLARTIMAGPLRHLRDAEAGLRIELHEGYRADLEARVAQNQLDVALVDGMPLALHAEIAFAPLSEEALYLFTAACGHSEHGDACSLHELGRFRLALPPATDGLRQALQEAANAAAVALHPAIEIESVSTLLDLALRDGWATILPLSLREYGSDPARWHCARIAHPAVHRRVGMIYRRDRTLSPLEHQLARSVAHALQAETAGMTEH